MGPGHRAAPGLPSVDELRAAADAMDAEAAFRGRNTGRICTNRCGAPVPAATRNQFMCNLPAGHTGAHALIKPPPPVGTSPNADRGPRIHREGEPP